MLDRRPPDAAACRRAAERQRRQRQRDKVGLIVARAEIEEIAFAKALVAAGRLEVQWFASHVTVAG